LLKFRNIKFVLTNPIGGRILRLSLTASLGLRQLQKGVTTMSPHDITASAQRQKLTVLQIILLAWFLIVCSIGIISSTSRSTVHAGTQQEGEKQVKKSSYLNEPVEIVELKNKTGKLPLNEKFKGPATEWLRGLTFTISNTSDKDITYLALNLFFPKHPDAEPSEPGYVFDLIFGVSPQSGYYNDFRQKHADKLLKRNNRLTLGLTDEQFEHIQQVLTSLGYPPNVESVEVWISEVGFDDKTIWKGGQIIKTGARPEPDNSPQVVTGKI
jgi:hypothetical protein